ncbi:hypothetical protein V2J09_006399 [Rumex salicifolius]
MEFWGVEVKGGKAIKVAPSDNEVIHLSQATLAELKNCNNPVMLYAKVGEQKLVIGVLTADTIPQISMDLVFEKEFELSHNWKNGVVHLTGYKKFSDDEELIPLEDKQNDLNALSLATKDKPAVPVAAGKKEDKAEDETDESDEEDSEDDDSSDESDTDMEKGDAAKSDDSDSDSEESDSEEETPVKPAAGKKRSASDTKTPEPKKAKLFTPQKSGGKKAGPVHVDTPHPAKNASKGDKSNVKTPKSTGQVSCGHSTPRMLWILIRRPSTALEGLKGDLGFFIWRRLDDMQLDLQLFDKLFSSRGSRLIHEYKFRCLAQTFHSSLSQGILMCETT